MKLDIRTTMPSACTRRKWLLALLAMFANAKQTCLRTAALLGCVFMTSSVACQGKKEGGIWSLHGVRVRVVESRLQQGGCYWYNCGLWLRLGFGLWKGVWVMERAWVGFIVRLWLRIWLGSGGYGKD